MKKFLLIDGMNLVFRSFYALPDLSNQAGLPTGAIHGFMKTFWKLQDMEKPQASLVFFDSKEATRHHLIHPQYKAQRAETPQELIAQIPLLIELLDAFGIPYARQGGVEADDLIASVAATQGARGHSVLIVSSDKDFAQCLKDPFALLLLPPPTQRPSMPWRHWGPEEVLKKFGVAPARIPDYLALTGDSSDNIEGIPGVGPKTAAKWLKEHGTIHNIIAESQHLKPERLGAKVKAGKKLLERNMELVTLERHHNVDLPNPQAPQVDRFRKLLENLELSQILKEALKRYERKGLQTQLDII